MSDRLTGLLTIIVALAFFASATQLEVPFFPDPMGSKLFPMMVSGVAVICGVALIIKPDPDAAWPQARVFIGMGIAVAILVAYALALRPLGFIIPTALAAAALSYQLEPRFGRAVITGSALSLGLFVIFKYALGLGLVALPRILAG